MVSGKVLGFTYYVGEDMIETGGRCVPLVSEGEQTGATIRSRPMAADLVGGKLVDYGCREPPGKLNEVAHWTDSVLCLLYMCTHEKIGQKLVRNWSLPCSIKRR